MNMLSPDGTSATGPHRRRRYVPADTGPDTGPGPRRTVSETLDWVGDDPARAEEALDAERASDKPRTSLVTRLEDLMDPDPEDEPETEE